MTTAAPDASHSAPPKLRTTMTWLTFALLSAVFAATNHALAKVGIKDVSSNLGTAIRTVFVLMMAVAIVLARGEQAPLGRLDARTWIFLGLSGIATGLSWLCYYRALQLGPISSIAAIDKLSVVLVIILGVTLFHDKLDWRTVLGGVLITAGALLMALR